MEHAAALLQHYGLAAVFLAMLLDMAGLPVPAFPLIVAAAGLAAETGVGAMAIAAAGIAGGVIADAAWFAASRRHGRKVLGLLCKISLSPDSCVRQTETLYARVGGLALLFAKCVPGLGLVAIALAAISEMSVLQFAVLDVLGEAIFVGTAVMLGAVFKTAVFAVIAKLVQLGSAGIAILVAAFVLYVVAKWWQRQAFIRQLRMDRITVEELADMLDRGEAPVILDVRPDLVRYEQGIIPGAIFAHPREAQQTLASYPRDTEVVVYCSCPNEVSAAAAANHLKRAGFKKIRPLLGGIEAWTKAGHAVALMDTVRAA